MDIIDLDLARLADVLGSQLGGSVDAISATALGASSRETPWRIDFSLNGLEKSVLLRYGKGCSRNEANILCAMEHVAIPTPRILIWDEAGDELGTPLFVSEFICGESLLPAMKAGESWAHDLYIQTATELQAIQASDLPDGAVDSLEEGESANEVLADAHAMMGDKDPLIEQAYRRLVDTKPALPHTQFSNGDLWPDNLLVRDRKLVGVIDWQHAGFSDPLFEFLLPFFLVPELRGLGIEERFCRHKGIDAKVLHWYHGLEFFDSLRWVLKTGKPYEMHTAESLRGDLETWLDATV